MASIFGHLFTGATIVKLSSIKECQKKLYFWSLASSFLPDLDVVSFIIGIPYEDPLGHRGFSHSVLFAILWSAFLILVSFKNSKFKFKYFLVLFFATFSHGILDALTDGGLGVGFFIPFESSRYFFPYNPIKVSPIGIQGFFEKGRPVIISEFYWVMIPCIFLILFQKLTVLLFNLKSSRKDNE